MPKCLEDHKKYKYAKKNHFRFLRLLITYFAKIALLYIKFTVLNKLKKCWISKKIIITINLFVLFKQIENYNMRNLMWILS